MKPATIALLCLAALPGMAGTRPELRAVNSVGSHLEEGPISNPRGVAYDFEADEVWVADTGNNLVGVFTADGLPLYAAAPGVEVLEPIKVVADGKGNLLALDNDRSRVALLNWRGEYQGPLELPGLPDEPVISAIALDRAGNLYVGESRDGEVIVYDKNRQLRFRLGSWGADEGQFQSIAGIAANDQYIVVTDHQAISVQVFDRRGNFVRGFGAHAMGIENFSLPEGVALDSRGRILVVDALRHEIKIFTIDGTFLARFGGYGKGPGEIAFPSDIAIGRNDRVYVSERGGDRIQIFDLTDVEVPDRGRRR